MHYNLTKLEEHIETNRCTLNLCGHAVNTANRESLWSSCVTAIQKTVDNVLGLKIKDLRAPWFNAEYDAATYTNNVAYRNML